MPWAQVPLPQIQNFNFTPAVKWRPLFLMETVLKKSEKKYSWTSIKTTY